MTVYSKFHKTIFERESELQIVDICNITENTATYIYYMT